MLLKVSRRWQVQRLRQSYGASYNENFLQSIIFCCIFVNFCNKLIEPICYQPILQISLQRSFIATTVIRTLAQRNKSLDRQRVMYHLLAENKNAARVFTSRQLKVEDYLFSVDSLSCWLNNSIENNYIIRLGVWI